MSWHLANIAKRTSGSREVGLVPTLVLFSLLTLATLSGCAFQHRKIADLNRFPQDVTAYLQPSRADIRLVPAATQARLDVEYNRQFFAPWEQQQASMPAEKAFWGIMSYGDRQGYAENLLPIGKQRWQDLVAALQRESYPSLVRPAITVRNTACRVFPTSRPYFFDPREAGEGYPFDYFQNSALWTGTPLLVTHRSRDGAWVFAESGFVSGWLRVQDIAWTDEYFRATYQSGSYAALLSDDVTLRDPKGDFLTLAHIGAIFPVVAKTDADLQILVPVRDADGNADLRPANVPTTLAALKPLPLQPGRIAELANRMLGQSYGWGGLYEDRDCSSTLRDLFTLFGLWLPRSSGKQAHSVGFFYNLESLSSTEKRKQLLRRGIPFYTLVWLEGHIGLYLGTDPQSGEPLLLHNMWGVRTTSWTGREGRALVGHLAVTSLRPGEERWDVKKGWFYRRILGMTVLPGAEGE